ncbi:MAG: septum formation protein Maf [Myxococcales bacterium]|nr:septum formation protein Maf [Myxococcales bacterium]
MPAASDVLVLASGSPRRRDLLRAAGVAIETVPPRVEEKAAPGESPAELVTRLAGEKALEVAQRLGPDPERIVLGSDTVVVLDGEVLGKPDDPAHAVAMLVRLAGRSHRVFTGVAVASSRALAPHTLYRASIVTLRPAGRDELERYVATGEPLDKAGAYAFQGEGRRFVTSVEGSESNVIGLPVEPTLSLVAEVRRACGLDA